MAKHSLIENINQTIADFDDIQDAINEKSGSGTVTNNDATSTYADKIRAIRTGDIGEIVSVVGGDVEPGKYVDSVTKSGSIITITKQDIPNVNIIGGEIETNKYVSSIMSDGHEITITKGTFPTPSTIPSIEIINGSTTTNQYVSGISASDHEITVTKTTLPTLPTAESLGAITNVKIGDTNISKSGTTLELPEYPTIPNLSIINGPAVTGQYISAISVSGHTLTISRGMLPTESGEPLPTIPIPGTLEPKMNGVANVGISENYAREDHIHPTDDKLIALQNLFTDNKVNSAINADVANSTKNSLIIKFDNGTIEDRDKFTFNGSTEKIINITPKPITIDDIITAWDGNTVNLIYGELDIYNTNSEKQMAYIGCNSKSNYGVMLLGDVNGTSLRLDVSGMTIYELENGPMSSRIDRHGEATFKGKVNSAIGFFETSDANLKNFYNDVKVDFNDLLKIPTKYFSWKNNDEQTLIGTSAQEVQKLYPELVSRNKNNELSVDYSKLSIICLAAIKELINEINILKSK